jgi:hypothetical protein
MTYNAEPISPIMRLPTAGDSNFSLNGPSIVVSGVGGSEYCACKSLNSDGTYALVKDRQNLSVGTRQSDGAYAWQILAKNGTTRYQVSAGRQGYHHQIRKTHAPQEFEIPSDAASVSVIQFLESTCSYRPIKGLDVQLIELSVADHHSSSSVAKGIRASYEAWQRSFSVGH